MAWSGSAEHSFGSVAGLTPTGTTLGPSRVTLAGLLKHLAYVEDENFTWSLLGAELGPPWDGLEVPDPGGRGGQRSTTRRSI